MNFSLNRIILFVHDVSLLKDFYQKYFNFQPSEETPGEWVVLQAGNCELALHKTGYDVEIINKELTNAKLVFEITGDLHAFRATLLADNVKIGEVKSFSGIPHLFCDGADLEGNVFQLMQRVV